MKRKIKEKFITVNKTRISTAFAVYFFVIFAILIIQLLTCGSQGFESFTFGKQADLQYEILDGHSIDTEFVVKQKNANSIVLNGYSDNDIKFKNYKIGEDTVFNSEIYSKAEKFIFIDAELYIYFNNTKSVSFTELWHEKWFDLLETRFISYDLLKEKNKILSAFYLERGMKFLLSYRFNLKGSPNENKFKKPIKKYFKKYYLAFMKCENISLKNKISVPIFFLFPFLYNKFRKMTDKTL